MTRRKDGRWQQRMTVIEQGRQKQKFFYGRTKQEVLKKIATYREAVEQGKLFKDVADEWWGQHESTLSPTAVRNYAVAKDRAVKYFKEKHIREILPHDIASYMDHIINKYSMAQKTAKNHKSVLNCIFVFAIKKGYTNTNPCREISVSKTLKKEPRRMPDSNDIKKIKESVHCTFGLFPYMALYTGLRKGELLALEWSDVDLENRTISVTKSLYVEHNKPKLKPPKTCTGVRTVPIVDKLYSVLKALPHSGIIFSNNGEYLTGKNYTDLFNQYKKESGVTCTAHQLRHAYATMLFEADVAVKDAQRILGHAQASTTQDVYTEMRKQRESVINESIRGIDIS